MATGDITNVLLKACEGASAVVSCCTSTNFVVREDPCICPRFYVLLTVVGYLFVFLLLLLPPTTTR